MDLFTSTQNAPITWEHLLRQTSDWSGTLGGKPDWADRPPRNQTPTQWEQRELHEAGPFYKHNDTRINVLALAALYVLKRPLPEVLDESIMTTIGASSSWHWEASDNAWVEIDGRRMKSVTGGGHFGGGMFVNAYDMARLPVPPTRRMGGSPGDLEKVDRDGEVARAGESHFRVLQLVSEQSLQGIRRDGRPSISIGASFVRYVSGQWYQRHLPGITIS